jgi:hypothetical protein
MLSVSFKQADLKRIAFGTMVPANYRLDRTCGAGSFGKVMETPMIGIEWLRSTFSLTPPGGQPGR